MFYRSNRLVKFMGQVYRSRLWLTYYGDEFHVDFRGHDFGLILRSNFRVDCTCFLMGRVYWINLRVEFTNQIFGPSLWIG